MPGPFPADPQAANGQADAPAADEDAVDLAQVVLQESGRPNGVPVAVIPGVGIDDLLQQGVDDAESRRRPSRSGGALQAGSEVLIRPLPKAQQPVVNGLPTDE